MVRWLLIMVLSAFYWGCGTTETPNDWKCVPGKAEACTCDDGASGAKSCDDEGQAFGSCLCALASDAGGIDTGVDIAESDAGEDTWDAGGDAEDTSAEDIVEDSVEVIEDITSDIEPDLPPQDIGPQPCDPPLAIAAEHYGLANTTVVLGPTGGTDAYHFELVTDESGALLDEIAGLHVLGNVIGAVDAVEVTDLGCIGSVSTTVQVIERFEVEPKQIQVGTGDAFQFIVTKGSGLFEFNFLTNASGGSLSPEGLYTAGDFEGVDSIEILDTGAGTVETAGVVVLEDASIEMVISTDILLVGQALNTEVTGGSGHLTLVEGDNVCLYEEGLLRCDTAGQHQLVFEDTYSSASVAVEVNVAASLPFAPIRGGDFIDDHTTQTVGDLNGDGFPDAILGSTPASVAANNGGAVYIYRGTADGVDATPAQVIGHEMRDVKFGQSYAVGDFRGDGVKDLVVAASRVSTDNLDRAGQVYLFEGKAEDFFQEEPSVIWEGQAGYSYFGSALGACDFNGDGFDDLAVGAYGDEDKSLNPVHSQQGVVYIYLGGVLGLSQYPAMSIRGMDYSGGQWVDQTELRMGWAIATGDINGDGACDIAIGAEHPFSKNCDDGAAYIHYGVKKDGQSAGGVEETPAYAVRGPSCKKTNVGFSLAMGDIDGDGLSDVLVPQKQYFPDGVNAGNNTYGRVYLLTGAHIVGQAGGPPEDIDMLPVLSEGGAGDREGFWVSAGDVNGDAIDDAIIGSLQDEISGNNPGTIRIFYGQEGELPAPAPDLEWEGQSSYERFGGAASVLGDVDDDGFNEMFLFSAREDSLGYDVGRPFLVWAAEEPELDPLDYPEEPAGDEFGASLAIIAFPGDKLRLVVAAPRHNRETQAKSGGVYIFPMDKGVLQPFNATLIDSHPRTANGKQFGHRVASVGDFDGDGVPDLGLIGFSEDDPNSYPATYECGPSCGAEAGTATCGANISGVGSLYIYRGQADGSFGENPSFVYYNDQKNDKIEMLAGVGNVDGDGAGRSDVAIGSRYWDTNGTDAGGVRVVTGRAYSVGGAKIQVICDPSDEFKGKKANDWTGLGITGLGDINEDGCDDFAFGEERNDDAGSERGAVTVVLGSGAASCPAEWQTLRLLPPNEYRYTGWAVTGGEDVDGDGVADLVVGVPHDSTVLRPGRAVLVSGAYIKKLFAEGASEAPLNDPDDGEEREVLGDANKGYCGVALALLPDYEADGRAALAMGCRRAKYGGMDRAGGAAIFRYTPGVGFSQEPEVTISGERQKAESYAGSALVFHKTDDGHLGVMGAPFGNATSLDSGSAYVFTVEAP